MTDYISREAALQAVFNEGYDNELDLGYMPHNEAFREIIEKIPAADVRPVVRGEWVKTMVENETPTIKSYTPVWSCPTCGTPFSPDTCKKWAGCPYCLTDMRKEADNNV